MLKTVALGSESATLCYKADLISYSFIFLLSHMFSIATDHSVHLTFPLLPLVFLMVMASLILRLSSDL